MDKEFIDSLTLEQCKELHSFLVGKCNEIRREIGYLAQMESELFKVARLAFDRWWPEGNEKV